ncbi:hypothetical protein FKL07_23200 [Citrobacter freundii]|nr:hypothetical protein [Citrobacter freundii]
MMNPPRCFERDYTSLLLWRCWNVATHTWARTHIF